MKKIYLALLLFTFKTVSSQAADPMKTLISIPDFALGPIGIKGSISEGELAFREILKRPSAEKDFLTVLNSGNAQARCYALVALHGISPKTYASYASRFVDNKTQVSIIGGCMAGKTHMYSIVRGIGAGSCDHYLNK